MQDGRKEAWSIPYVYVAVFFPSLKQNFIAYRPARLWPDKAFVPATDIYIHACKYDK